MTGRIDNGIVRIECGVELRLTPMARRAGAWEDFHQAALYGVHTHNMNTEAESGEFVALALSGHNLEGEGPEQVGDVVTIFGSKTALERFLSDTPQVDKVVRKRIAMHGEIQPAADLQKGVAYIRDRTHDKANRLRKTDPKAASRMVREAKPHVALGLSKFPMRIQPAAGAPMQTGRVSTYGLSSQKAPVYL